MPITRAQTRACMGSFRFLDLPPELRNELYTLALGGRLIHVGTHMREGEHLDRVAICTVSPNETQTTDITLPNVFHSRHDDCHQRPSQSLDFSLLYTAKQLYEEAKNITISSNTFAFCSVRGIVRLIERMGEERAGNIRNVLFYSANNVRPWSCPAIDLSSLPFSRLEAVYVYLELCRSDIKDALYPPRRSKIDFANPGGQHAVFGGLQGLRKFEPGCVRITIQSTFQYEREYPAQAVLDQWKMGVKQMIVGDAESANKTADSGGA